jgi:hypothetical protein
MLCSALSIARWSFFFASILARFYAQDDVRALTFKCIAAAKSCAQRLKIRKVQTSANAGVIRGMGMEKMIASTFSAMPFVAPNFPFPALARIRAEAEPRSSLSPRQLSHETIYSPW